MCLKSQGFLNKEVQKHLRGDGWFPLRGAERRHRQQPGSRWGQQSFEMPVQSSVSNLNEAWKTWEQK